MKILTKPKVRKTSSRRRSPAPGEVERDEADGREEEEVLAEENDVQSNMSPTTMTSKNSEYHLLIRFYFYYIDILYNLWT